MVKLYEAAWSVYVWIARLALEEKQIKYSLVEVDVVTVRPRPFLTAC
nr:glutathione S-transferase N-terminal domain-containing protein [uncultured Paraburkholderia sp.]